MAAVKGILVNDGGAPARIINFLAGEAISAGEVLKPSTSADMTCLLATNPNHAILGVALTDAASGEMCSIITGSGVICYILCTDETAGVALMVDTIAGQLDQWSGGGADDPGNIVAAMCLEDAAAGLTKCLLL